MIISDYTENWLDENIRDETFNKRKLLIEEILFRAKFNLRFYLKFGFPQNQKELDTYYSKFDTSYFNNKKIREYGKILEEERKSFFSRKVKSCILNS